MAQIYYDFPDARMQTMAHAVAPSLVPSVTFDENGDAVPLTGIAFLANRLVEGDVGTAAEHLQVVTAWATEIAHETYEDAVGETAAQQARDAVTW